MAAHSKSGEQWHKKCTGHNMKSEYAAQSAINCQSHSSAVTNCV